MGRHRRSPVGHRRRRLPRADGPEGMAELGETVLARTTYAASALAALDGVEARRRRGALPRVRARRHGCGARPQPELRRRGPRIAASNPAHALGDSRLLVCVTEQNTQTDIDELAAVLGAALAQKEQNA